MDPKNLPLLQRQALRAAYLSEFQIISRLSAHSQPQSTQFTQPFQRLQNSASINYNIPHLTFTKLVCSSVVCNDAVIWRPRVNSSQPCSATQKCNTCSASQSWPASGAGDSAQGGARWGWRGCGDSVMTVTVVIVRVKTVTYWTMIVVTVRVLTVRVLTVTVVTVAVVTVTLVTVTFETVKVTVVTVTHVKLIINSDGKIWTVTVVTMTVVTVSILT